MSDQPTPPGDSAPRPGGGTCLALVAATALFFAACAYLLGSMAGWWTGREWMDIAAVAVLAGTLLVSRLATK